MTAGDLTRVCAWCKKILHQGPPGATVTHGICKECAKKILVEYEKSKEAKK